MYSIFNTAQYSDPYSLYQIDADAKQLKSLAVEYKMCGTIHAKASSVLTPSHGAKTKRILSYKVLKVRVERQFTLLCNSLCLHLRFHGDLLCADFCAGITNSLPVIS